MKSRLSAFILTAVVLLIGTVPILGQTLNPPYLSQMPTVERVKAEIKGSDPVDTSARQIGALQRLQDIIKTLAGPRFRSNEFTPDESRFIGQYFGAWQRYLYKENSPPPQDQPRWYKLRAFYETDPGFLEDLLKRFFSAEFHAAYNRATGKQPPQLATLQPTTRPTAPPAAQPSTSGGASAEAYVAQGNKYFAAKDYAKAIEAFKKAIALDPRISGAHFGLSTGYFILEQYKNALPAAQESVRLEPTNYAYHRALGLTYYNLQQYRSALSSLQEAVRLKADDPHSHQFIGNVYADGFKQYEKAVQEYREAIRLKPDYDLAHNQLGEAFFRLEEYPDAAGAFQQAIRLNPKIPKYRYNLGLTYHLLGRRDEALQVYRTLLSIDKAQAQQLYAEINKGPGSPPAAKSRNAASQPASGGGQPSNSGKQSSPQTSANKPPQTAAKSPAQELADLQAKAERGDIAAQKKLSDYYYDQAYGDEEGDVPEDISNKMEANGLKWLRKAAESGDVDAQSSLGDYYVRGIRAPKNVEEGRKWLYKAAGQGSAAALQGLCIYSTDLMDLSKGIDPNHFPLPAINSNKQDITEAFKWCGKAAQTGGPESTYRLGLLYTRGGADIKPDYEQGYFWLKVRLISPRPLRDAVGKQLIPEKRAEIETRARAWKPTTTTPRTP